MTDTSPMPAPRRALFVWPDAGGLGGVSTFTRHCRERMANYGWEVALLATRDPAAGGSDVFPWRTRGRDTVARLRQRLHCIVEQTRPALVVIQETVDAEDVLRLLPAPLPVVNIMHNCRPDDRYFRLAAELACWGAWTACVSDPTREGVRAALGGRRSPPVETLYLGVDPVAAQPDRAAEAGPVRLIYAGRLENEQKQVGDLVPFVQALERRGVAYRLDIAGDGPERDALDRQFAAQVAAGRVVFHGALPHAGLLEAFARADVFVLVSRYEGLPLAMLEAMNRGCVPVVPDIPCGMRDVVEQGVNGFRPPPRDPETAAGCVATLAADRARWRACSTAAVATARRYTLAAALERYARFFDRAAVAAPTVVPHARAGLLERARDWFRIP